MKKAVDAATKLSDNILNVGIKSILFTRVIVIAWGFLKLFCLLDFMPLP